MAGGWTKDGAVQDQIDDTVSDAVRNARARMHHGLEKRASAEFCDDCGERIPQARRLAIQGVRTCVQCQSERDESVSHSTFNRRGSKDSQLR